MLSDKIKQVTSAVGIEPCSGCEKRAATLDEWQRRGFIKTGALALIGLKNSTLKLAWLAAGKTLPVSVLEALSLVRMINTVQVVWHSKHGKHASREEVLAEILTHVEHFKLGTVAYAWLSRLTPLASEVLPGWTLDYASVSEGYPRRVNPGDADWVVNDGYRLVLKNDAYSFVSDEAAVIYRAKTPTEVPAAASMERAAVFPGAVPYTQFVEDDSAWNRVKRFLTPVAVVHADACCDRPDCIYGCDTCTRCIACCVGCACSGSPLGGVCLFNTGCASPCTWLYSTCITNNCNCCVNKFFPGGCCLPNICCFTCRTCVPC